MAFLPSRATVEDIMRFKKWTVLTVMLLCLAILGSTFASCGASGRTNESGVSGAETGNQNQETDSGDQGNTRETISPDIPNTYDWGGETVKFLCWWRPDWDATVRVYRDITSSDLTGDLVGDAVFLRNNEIEERYKVSIEMDLVQQNDVPTIVRNQVKTGSNEYDVVYPRLLEAATMVTDNVFLNLFNVPNLDLTKPWWDQSCIDNLSISNALYYCATSLNVNDKDATAAMAFNKQTCKDNNIPFFYDVVESGEWTIDLLATYAEQVLNDLDGNDIINEQDFYGFLGKDDVCVSFFMGSGSQIVTKTDEYTYELTVGEDRDIDVMEDIVYYMNEDWFYNQHVANIDDIQYTQLFTSGHGLFFWMRLDEVTNMRASEVDFGILPIPKYEEDQDFYYSMVSPHTTGILSIPSSLSGDRLERVGMIIEALSANSHYNLQYAYVDQSLMTKFSKDEESASSVAKVLEHRVFDPGYLYDFGSIREEFLRMGHKQSNLSTTLASLRGVTEARIDKFLTAIDEMQ